MKAEARTTGGFLYQPQENAKNRDPILASQTTTIPKTPVRNAQQFTSLNKPGFSGTPNTSDKA